MKNVTSQNLNGYIASLVSKQFTKPVEFVTAELDSIHKALEPRIADFTGRGLKTDFLKLGAPVSALLADADHQWISAQFDLPAQILQWKKSSIEGYQFRDDLEEDIELALEDIPEAMKTVAIIKEGKGPENMLDDIAALVVLGRKYLTATVAGGISEDRLTEAEQFCKDLRELFAKASVTPETKGHLKEHRDQVKTFAKEYLATIRRYADKIYKYDEETRALFSSPYEMERSRAARAKAKAKAKLDAEMAAKLAQKS